MSTLRKTYKYLLYAIFITLHYIDMSTLEKLIKWFEKSKELVLELDNDYLIHKIDEILMDLYSMSWVTG